MSQIDQRDNPQSCPRCEELMHYEDFRFSCQREGCPEFEKPMTLPQIEDARQECIAEYQRYGRDDE